MPAMMRHIGERRSKKRVYRVIGSLRMGSWMGAATTEDVIGYVVAKSKHQALLKALLKEEDIQQKLHRYFWDSIRVESTKHKTIPAKSFGEWLNSEQSKTGETQ